MKPARMIVTLLMVWCVLCAASARGAQEHSLIDGLGRAGANLLAGWLELPQCVTYYSVEYPVIGFVPGVLQGAGMTAVRAFGGVIDLLTAGYLAPGNTVYDAVEEPLLPWDGPWLPVTRAE